MDWQDVDLTNLLKREYRERAHEYAKRELERIEALPSNDTIRRLRDGRIAELKLIINLCEHSFACDALLPFEDLL